MSKKAPKSELNELHAEVARTLKNAIKEAPTAAVLNVARAFLKDNGVDILGQEDPEAEREFEELMDEADADGLLDEMLAKGK